MVPKRIRAFIANSVLIISLISSFFSFAAFRVHAANSVSATDLDAKPAVEWMQALYQRIWIEKISAPTASRLYAYAGITLYQAVQQGIPGDNTLSGQLNRLPDMPQLDNAGVYDWGVVADGALDTVLDGLMGTNDSRAVFDAVAKQHISGRKAQVADDVIQRSLTYGNSIGTVILAWAAKDNYQETRNKSFILPTGDSKWIPTTPGTSPIEPYWGSLRTFAMPDAEYCQVPYDMPFSTDENSPFYAQALEVKVTHDNLTDDQKNIARFWVDTPGISGTPAGHWVSIENQLVEVLNLKLAKAAEMYGLVGIVLGDAFIECWQEKYQVFLLRPETYIQRYISRSYAPYIQTPAFPEYPSGHSVVSAAAAEVLTGMFGEVAFTDKTHESDGLEPRSFTSFAAAANEAAISRLYAGIHLRVSLENGLTMGRCIGQRVLKKIQLSPLPQPYG